MRALVLALLLVSCSAGELRGGATSFGGGSADPIDHFLQVCADLAPSPPGELSAESGWISQPYPFGPEQPTITPLLARKWNQGGGERPNYAWIGEWGTSTPETSYLSYTCAVTFNGPSFEEIDARLKHAGFRYRRVAGASEALQGTPREQRSDWSGISTLASYESDESYCVVRLDHGERDPIGAPCEECRQNVLSCHVDSRDLPPAERAAWHARRNFPESG